MSVIQILCYNEPNKDIYSRLDAIVNRFLVQVGDLIYT